MAAKVSVFEVRLMPSSSRKPLTFSPPCHPEVYCPRAVVRSSREGRTTLDSTFCFS